MGIYRELKGAYYRGDLRIFLIFLLVCIILSSMLLYAIDTVATKGLELTHNADPDASQQEIQYPTTEKYRTEQTALYPVSSRPPH